jgi:transcription elongation factor GreA
MPNPNQNRRSASRQQTQDSRFDGVAFHVAQRERSRKIKLHQETEKATSKGDAVVLTQAGLPDMRFAEDKSKFSRDPRRRRRISDNQPDRRFLENRPDLLEVRRQRGEDLSWAQGRLLELEQIINNSEIITHKKTGLVAVGSKVNVKIQGKEREYTIVGPQEVSPAKGFISNESPLGSNLIGHKVGDTVEIEVPAGKQIYQILSIE